MQALLGIRRGVSCSVEQNFLDYFSVRLWVGHADNLLYCATLSVNLCFEHKDLYGQLDGLNTVPIRFRRTLRDPTKIIVDCAPKYGEPAGPAYNCLTRAAVQVMLRQMVSYLQRINLDKSVQSIQAIQALAAYLKLTI